VLVRRLVFALIPLSFAADAGAQIIRPGIRFNEPSVWVSLGVGQQNAFDVHDGTTGSVWQFSNATQYSASIEKTLSGGSGATIGVRGNYARVPLFYSSASTGAGADADADVSQIMGVLHVASGREFHTVLDVSVGATIFSNFRSRTTGGGLEPTSPDADFAYAFGYGVGYNFSPTFALDVVQDISTSLHQKTGLGAGESTSNRFSSTRLIARFGLGKR
jgi:hypothetical protein